MASVARMALKGMLAAALGVLAGTPAHADERDFAPSANVVHAGGTDTVVVTRDPDTDAVGVQVARGGRVVAENPVFASALEAPAVRVLANGSVVVRATWTGIGRSPWEEHYTLAFRRGTWVVAGYTRSAWDRLDGTGRTCDLNLLTGRGIVTDERGRERRVRASLRSVPLADWRAVTDLPRECGFP